MMMRQGDSLVITVLSIVVIIGFFVALSFAFGWIDVYKTKTIDKAKANAETEVFEQTKSFIDSKRMDASKYYSEYILTKDVSEKRAIANVVKMMFIDFDEVKYIDNPDIKDFITNAKSGKLP